MAVKKTAKIQKEKTSVPSGHLPKGDKTKTAPKKKKEAVLAVPSEVEKLEQVAPVEETEETGKAGEAESQKEKGRPEKYYEAVGRRKSAIARVRLFTKGSEIIVNGHPFDSYFSIPELRQVVEAPFRKMKNLGKFRTEIKIVGGGPRGQAEAARHGISRALTKFNVDFRKRLKKAGYLTRDARVKERRKYGLKKARRAPQWQKR